MITLSARSDERLSEFADAVQKRVSALAVAHDFIDFSAAQADERQPCSLQTAGALGQPCYGGETAGRLERTISATGIVPLDKVT